MLSKSILKYIQSLHLKKFRDEHNVFIAEGTKVVVELLASGQFICEMIFAVADFFEKNSNFLLPDDLNNKWIINENELGRMSLLQSPDKVLAVFFQKEEADIILQKKVNLMLDGIRDPGNMGTIIRIADWFGIPTIICSPDCAEQYNPKVVQSSMGSIARVNITRTELAKFLSNTKVDSYAATLNGRSLHSCDKIEEGLLLIGNESKGISSDLLSLVKDQITIPGRGGAESLNAAVATGIILSHLIDV